MYKILTQGPGQEFLNFCLSGAVRCCFPTFRTLLTQRRATKPGGDRTLTSAVCPRNRFLLAQWLLGASSCDDVTNCARVVVMLVGLVPVAFHSNSTWVRLKIFVATINIVVLEPRSRQTVLLGRVRVLTRRRTQQRQGWVDTGYVVVLGGGWVVYSGGGDIHVLLHVVSSCPVGQMVNKCTCTPVYARVLDFMLLSCLKRTTSEKDRSNMLHC